MGDTVAGELQSLEEEEANIMRELREMDAAAAGARSRVREDPRGALAALLAECEKEVRDAKGYIADHGPPLRIARVPAGAPIPKGKNCTFLSRPKSTGVDFTIPVVGSAYRDVVKVPVFLNDIRDKCKGEVYSNCEEYLEDMRLLARNTAAFNKGVDLAWVVQHARLLLEAAEDAVTSRRRALYDAEEALRSVGTAARSAAVVPAGKRKRGEAVRAAADGVKASLNIGDVIHIFWDRDRKWYSAVILEKGPGVDRVHVEYDDRSREWLNLDEKVKWRMPPATPTSAGHSSGASRGTKRRKAATVAAAASPRAEPAVVAAAGISAAELEAVQRDMGSKMDDLRDSLMDSMNARFARVDDALIRSDALHRVLIAVQDVQASVETSVGELRAEVAALKEGMVAAADVTPAAFNTEADIAKENVEQEQAPHLQQGGDGATATDKDAVGTDGVGEEDTGVQADASSGAEPKLPPDDTEEQVAPNQSGEAIVEEVVEVEGEAPEPPVDEVVVTVEEPGTAEREEPGSVEKDEKPGGGPTVVSATPEASSTQPVENGGEEGYVDSAPSTAGDEALKRAENIDNTENDAPMERDPNAEPTESAEKKKSDEGVVEEAPEEETQEHGSDGDADMSAPLANDAEEGESASAVDEEATKQVTDDQPPASTVEPMDVSAPVAEQT